LARGLVVDSTEANPYKKDEKFRRNGEAMRELNAHVAKDPRVEVVVLPLFDGLGLIRLKD
jgi:predicted O-methyltransferase YrrM